MVEDTDASGNYPELDEFYDTLAEKNGALIPLLHFAQEEYGHLSTDVQLYVARKLGIPAAKVYGVATFYSFFSMKKKGHFIIKVCMGTACFVGGGDAIRQEFEKELKIKSSETTEDGLFSLDTIRCVGACGLGPVVMVGDKVYGRVKPEEVKGIVDECLGKVR